MPDQVRPEPDTQSSTREIVSADKLHKAELAQWKSAFDSAMVEWGKRPREEFLAAGKDGKMENAKLAGDIGKIVAGLKDDPTKEIFVSRRGGRSVGVMTVDSYGANKGYPLTVDWLASHPDVILGKVKEKGIGTELLQHAIKRAAELKVGLQLQSASGARSFYEKMGMKPMAALGDHYTYSPEQVREIAKTIK